MGNKTKLRYATISFVIMNLVCVLLLVLLLHIESFKSRSGSGFSLGFIFDWKTFGIFCLMIISLFAYLLIFMKFSRRKKVK